MSSPQMTTMLGLPFGMGSPRGSGAVSPVAPPDPTEAPQH
jgi:hypothetical protein